MTSRRRRFFFFVGPLVFAVAGIIAVDRLFFQLSPLPEPARPRKANALDAAFVIGANLPWVNYGQDFGESAWGYRGFSDPGNRAVLELHFQNLQLAGVTVVRLFVLCDGRSGLKTNARGEIAGLDDKVMLDFESALDVARKYS